MSLSPDSLLVRLKDKIMLKLNIDSFKLKHFVQEFVRVAFYETSGSKNHYTVVNLLNEFTNSKMTIKVFFKFLNVIRVKRVSITISLVTSTDREITVHETINLSTLEELKESKE